MQIKNIYPGANIVVWKNDYRDNNIKSSEVSTSSRLIETTVEKIGTKYFYVKGISNRFDKQTHEDMSSCGRDLLFNTIQEVVDYYLHQELATSIRGIVGNWGWKANATLNQLKRIDYILKE